MRGSRRGRVGYPESLMGFPLRFDITGRSGTTQARVGRVQTPHGYFDTPAFMPVGTKATVKGLFPASVAGVGSQIILNNTYHLMLRPGSELIARRGGVHRFMRWEGPILTDSGGYQAFSLSDINQLSDEGVTFRSVVDGSLVHMTPERSIEVQNELGADIIMAFDDCPPSVDPAMAERKRQVFRGKLASLPRKPSLGGRAGRRGGAGADGGAYERRLDEAMERTARWLERCAKAHGRRGEQALFGIVQGGTDLARRAKSVEQICSVDLPGYAIGGVAVGESSELIGRIVEHTAPLLPADRPRYLMGVGYEWDIVSGVRSGVDMFDCVLPTRNGRNAAAFTRRGRINLRNRRFAEDEAPIDESCECPVCTGGEGLAWGGREGGFSKSYLRHLFQAEEMLGPVLVSLHNIAHFQSLMRDVREVIVSDNWPGLWSRWPVLSRCSGEAGRASEGEI